MRKYPGGGWPELQFGHGCDAVEIPSASRRGVAARPLQFGHGCDAVEMGLVATVSPESMGRFNSATAVMPWRFDATTSKAAARKTASIRPRL